MEQGRRLEQMTGALAAEISSRDATQFVLRLLDYGLPGPGIASPPLRQERCDISWHLPNPSPLPSDYNLAPASLWAAQSIFAAPGDVRGDGFTRRA